MPTITIDTVRCTSCGTCIAVCPLRVLHFDADNMPVYIPGGDDRCIICGHCEAVCPSEALDLADQRLQPDHYSDGGFPVAKELLATQVRMRRSIRQFNEQPVPRSSIEELLEVVRFAPTGTNSQQLHWLIIYNRQELLRLTGFVVDWMRHLIATDHPLTTRFNLAGMIKAFEKGNDPICRNAPHLVLVHADASRPVNQVDGIIALTQFDLLAPSFGIGCCWGGFFQYACEGWPPLRDALGLPASHRTIYAMMIGTPVLRFQRPPKRNHAAISWIG